MNIDWSLIGRAPDIGERIRKGLEEGRNTARRYTQDNALAALAHDPTNQAARADLWRADPAIAANYETHSQKRAEAQREAETRGALSDWLLSSADGQPNALAGSVPGTSQTSLSGQMPSAPMGPVTSPAAAPRRPTAYERAVRADPEGFLSFQGKRLDVTTKQLKNARDLNDAAMQLLGGVHDQPSYDAAKQRAAQLYSSYGHDAGEFISGLPPQYTPDVVEGLRMQGMDTSKQVAAIARENRLDLDAADDEADNERADRNVDSQVSTRQGQLANTRRGQDLSNARGRRGQDLADQRGRRGQDLSDSRGRRGQDITDTRGRRGQDLGGGRGRRTAGQVATAVGPDGRRIVVRNGKWVDAQTGRPVQ